VPALDTSKLSAGTLPIARGGTGVSPTGVVGDANKFFGLTAAGTAGEMKTITQGAGVSVTHGVGTITIAATGSGGTVTNVTATAPLGVSNGTSTPELTLTQATTSTNGYLSSTDWNTFNNKLAAIADNSITSAKIVNGAVAYADLNMTASTVANAGLLVSDGTNFANKICGSNEVLLWTVANGWACNAVVLTETDPQVGANTTNSISKWDGSALVASGIIEASGNVGIGTASPAATLEVVGAGQFSSTLSANSLWVNGSIVVQSDRNFYNLGGTVRTSNAFNFSTGGSATSRLHISTAGDVGIGTTSPSTMLHVNGTATVQSSVEGAAASVDSGTAYSISDLTKNIRRINLTGNVTITLPVTTGLAADMAYSLTIRVKQDATGSRTLAWSSGANTIKWDSGSAPAHATSANTETIYQFLLIGGETVWYGSQVWKEN